MPCRHPRLHLPTRHGRVRASGVLSQITQCGGLKPIHCAHPLLKIQELRRGLSPMATPVSSEGHRDPTKLLNFRQGRCAAGKEVRGGQEAHGGQAGSQIGDRRCEETDGRAGCAGRGYAPTSCPARYPVSRSRETRSWPMVSRSRTVTALSSRESKSTVTQNGVPTSSCRR